MIMIINANTKIAKILNHNPAALDAIVSINPKFEKLRNPLLRKLMAGRTSIGMASKIGDFSVEKFFEKLAPLGFEIDTDTPHEKTEEKTKVPAFFHGIKSEQVIDFDVRPIISAGADPLKQIVEKVKTVPAGGVLKITNSFAPTPLISLLEKQGFQSYVDEINDELVETYFYKKGEDPVIVEETGSASDGWEEMMKKFEGKLEEIDVRHLEMPMPMMTILAALDKITNDKALFVYHKRIPVFLLPELRERQFDYRIKEISENEVRLLIFKD
jgi:uncharacterized protein (DUF2249 family)